MDVLITESQRNSLELKLEQSIEKNGIVETLTRYKLGIAVFDKIYQKKLNLNCQELGEFIDFIFKKKHIKENYYANKHRYKMELSYDRMSGGIYYDFKDNLRDDIFVGIATPYWNGECEFPIDCDRYIYKDEDGYSDEIDITGYYQKNKKIKSEFNSLKDIINYIEGQYESYVIPTSINFLEKARTHI
jgi:hypothetical protein